jgi:hypothetical protein
MVVQEVAAVAAWISIFSAPRPDKLLSILVKRLVMNLGSKVCSTGCHHEEQKDKNLLMVCAHHFSPDA